MIAAVLFALLLPLIVVQPWQERERVKVTVDRRRPRGRRHAD
jgi:hypothetical protein